MRPKGKDFDDAVAYWKTLQTDERRNFRYRCHSASRRNFTAGHLGHQSRPGDFRDDNIPDPASFADPVERASAEKALAYMGLNRVFR